MSDTVKMQKKLRCSICGLPIEPTSFGWAGGNNAAPVNNGRCCDHCNTTVVIPHRLRLVLGKRP